MKAILCTQYGPPEILQLKEIAKPVPRDYEVLVKICAASVNPLDLQMRGGAARLWCGFSRPKDPRLGRDIAGRVEAGKVTPLVDRVYPLSETGKALGYLRERRARGKIVITMDQPPSVVNR